MFRNKENEKKVDIIINELFPEERMPFTKQRDFDYDNSYIKQLKEKVEGNGKEIEELKDTIKQLLDLLDIGSEKYIKDVEIQSIFGSYTESFISNRLVKKSKKNK